MVWALKKRYIKNFICVLCMILPACAGRMQDIRKNGVLRVAMQSRNESPFVISTKAKSLTGIDVNLAKNIAKHLGVSVAFIRTAKTPDQVIAQVARGEADLGISNLSITLDRALHVGFSLPYIHLHKAVLLGQASFGRLKKNDQESVRSFFTGNNKLGVMRESSYVEFARAEFPEAQLVHYDDWGQLIQDLRQGKIAGGFWDQFEVEKVVLLEPHGLLDYLVVQLQVPTDKVAIALPKDDPHFLRWINTFMEIQVSVKNARDLAVSHMRYEHTK